MSLQSPTICTRCDDLSENPDGWRSNATRVLVEELKYTSPGVGGGHPPSIVDLSTLVALDSADFDVKCLVTVRPLVCNQLLCLPPFSLFIGTDCGLYWTTTNTPSSATLRYEASKQSIGGTQGSA